MIFVKRTKIRSEKRGRFRRFPTDSAYMEDHPKGCPDPNPGSTHPEHTEGILPMGRTFTIWEHLNKSSAAEPWIFCCRCLPIYCESVAFTVKIDSSASGSPLTGQLPLMQNKYPCAKVFHDLWRTEKRMGIYSEYP